MNILLRCEKFEKTLGGIRVSHGIRPVERYRHLHLITSYNKNRRNQDSENRKYLWWGGSSY